LKLSSISQSLGFGSSSFGDSFHEFGTLIENHFFSTEISPVVSSTHHQNIHEVSRKGKIIILNILIIGLGKEIDLNTL